MTERYPDAMYDARVDQRPDGPGRDLAGVLRGGRDVRPADGAPDPALAGKVGAGPAWIAGVWAALRPSRPAGRRPLSRYFRYRKQAELWSVAVPVVRDDAVHRPGAGEDLACGVCLPLAIQSWSLTSLQQRLFKAGGRLRPRPGRELLDRALVLADRCAHRAAHVAPDVIERTAPRLGVSLVTRARVSLRRGSIGGTSAELAQ